jgi:hypothetical protein
VTSPSTWRRSTAVSNKISSIALEDHTTAGDVDVDPRRLDSLMASRSAPVAVTAKP